VNVFFVISFALLTAVTTDCRHRCGSVLPCCKMLKKNLVSLSSFTLV